MLSTKKAQFLTMQNNQQFVESLIGLREYYQGLLGEHERQVAWVKEQLAHVNALLADQLVLQHNQPVSIEALTLTSFTAQSEAFDIGSEESAKSASQPNIDNWLSFEPNTAEEPNEVDETNEVDEPGDVDSADAPTPAPIAVVQSEAEPSLDSSVNGQVPISLLPPLKTPMLPPYQLLTKLQAVESLLRQSPGTVLRIDYIVRALHGELEPDAMKVEKSRMTQTLSEGAKKGLWHKVPQQPGCYTIDLKLVEPELSSKDTAQQSKVGFRRRPQFRGNPSNNMLPRYQKMNFTEAVETVVSENAGQILSTEKVARALYGELSGQVLTKAKQNIGKTLWSGANQKRWQRVPGKPGYYTLDLRLVDPELASASS